MANQYTKGTTFDARAILQQMQDAVLQQARMPNIYAYKPHPKQVKFHSLPHKERLFVAGNRSGKSLASVVEGIWYPPRRTRTGRPRRGRSGAAWCASTS